MTQMNTQDTKSPQRMLTLFMGVLLIALFMVSSFSWAGSRNDITDHTRLGTEFSLTNAKSFGEFRNDTWHNTFSECYKPAPADPAYTEITLNGWNNPAPDTAIHETVTVVDSSCYDPITKASEATLACDGEDKGNWGKIATTGICGRVFQLCDQKYSYVKTWENAVISGAPKTITTWTRIVNNRVNCQEKTGANDQMVLLKENDLCYPNPDTDKSSCVQNFPITGVKKPLSVTAITGDDMFKINKETLDGSFFEYQRAGDFDDPGHSLKWIANTGDKDMMLPSGPLSGGNAYSDYTNFMKLADDGKIGGVTTADACYAMKTSLCANIDGDEDGECGSAVSAPANTYGNLSQIPYSAFCNAGVVIDESETGTTAKWKCYAATAPVECEITIGSPVVNALCGTAHNTLFEPVTDAQFCLTGTQTATIGAWSWACNGSNGGNNVVCSATAVLDCGTAHNQDTASIPIENFCNDVSTVPVTGTGPWSWTCGANSCSADPITVLDCGTAINVATDTMPTSELCNDNSEQPPVASGNNNTTWDWTCGANACSAEQTADEIGVCDNTAQNACSVGAINDQAIADTTTHYQWRCDGADGNSGTCSIAIPVVGVCGDADGDTTETAPSGTDLCEDGQVPDITETETEFTWTCPGTNDGDDTPCSADKRVCSSSWTIVEPESTTQAAAKTPDCGPNAFTETAINRCEHGEVLGDSCDGSRPSCFDFSDGTHLGGTFKPYSSVDSSWVGGGDDAPPSGCSPVTPAPSTGWFENGPYPCLCEYKEIACVSTCN